MRFVVLFQRTELKNFIFCPSSLALRCNLREVLTVKYLRIASLFRDLVGFLSPLCHSSAFNGGKKIASIHQKVSPIPFISLNRSTLYPNFEEVLYFLKVSCESRNNKNHFYFIFDHSFCSVIFKVLSSVSIISNSK